MIAADHGLLRIDLRKVYNRFPLRKSAMACALTEENAGRN